MKRRRTVRDDGDVPFPTHARARPFKERRRSLAYAPRISIQYAFAFNFGTPERVRQNVEQQT
ncbi:MAG TPA: hypothetical protein VMA30_14110, partial [Xanthobacteraceae bacterium]|nr:hypothetical protein [Xanthobacteraceae bacterium]